MSLLYLIVLLVLPYTVGHVICLRFGNQTRAAIICGSPFVFVLAYGIGRSLRVGGYDPSCDSECWHNLVLSALVIAAWASLEIGAIAGWAHAALRARRAPSDGSSQPPQS